MRTSGTRPYCLKKVQSTCELRGASQEPRQWVPDRKSSSGAEGATSGFVSSAGMDHGVPMEFQKGSRASSHVETFKSAFLLSCTVVSGVLSS